MRPCNEVYDRAGPGFRQIQIKAVANAPLAFVHEAADTSGSGKPSNVSYAIIGLSENAPPTPIAERQNYEDALNLARDLGITGKSGHPDPLAIFTIAHALMKAAESPKDYSEITEAYKQPNEFARECLRVATAFEEWASEHVDFDPGRSVTWPYVLQELFVGSAAWAPGWILRLREMDSTHWPRIAAEMKLALKPSVTAEGEPHGKRRD